MKFTSAVPFAMITPVSPPIFNPNSTVVSSGAISRSTSTILIKEGLMPASA